ncbi:MAG: right-handed parallel beta-helix repeat-containing protein, partial [bacterium]
MFLYKYFSNNLPEIFYVLSVSLFFFGLLSFSRATIIHVPADTMTIQGGIGLASDEDTVLVADGRYYENINFKGKKITVASHFIINRDSSHIDSTIIDGSQPLHPDSGSVVLMISGEDTTSVLCGFTITGGSGTIIDEGTELQRLGGGILCRYEGGRIQNNIIEYNEIISDFFTGGGGIAVSSAATIGYAIIENNTIRANRIFGVLGRKSGGGIFWSGNGRILKNNIYNNEVRSITDYAIGGGIRLLTSLGGPHAVCRFDSNIVFQNLAISENLNAYGGGINADGHRLYMKYNVIKGNTVQGNNNSFGAGVDLGYVRHGESIIEGNYIVENLNLGPSRIGGGLRLWSSTPIIQNNVIASNQAEWGAGILSQNEEQFTSINNTITNNNHGGIQTWNNSSALVLNTIVWNNSGIQLGGNITTAFCNIEGGWPGTGNISSDPFFADTLFHLSDSSNCIGFGQSKIVIGGATYYAPFIDFDGELRPNPIDSFPDIGAFESAFPAWARPQYTRLNHLRPYIHPINDTLEIGVKALNPNQQTLSIITNMYYQGGLWDEIQLFDDGLHGDSLAGDMFFANKILPLFLEETFEFTHRFIYQPSQKSIIFSESQKITSVGPLSVSEFRVYPSTGNHIQLYLILYNEGQNKTAENIRADLIPRDGWGIIFSGQSPNFGNIVAGDTSSNNSPFIVEIDTSNYPGYLTFDVEIKSNGYTYWTHKNLVIPAQILDIQQPQNVTEHFALYQNHPNPFNPKTVIRWQLAVAGKVSLEIYNLKGQKITTLLSTSLLPGLHSVEFDASNLASGVYFYRLEA